MRIKSFQPSPYAEDTGQIGRQQRQPETANGRSLAQVSARISIQRLQQRLAAAPEVRRDRVDAVKQAMESGTYNKVSNAQLANALFNEFFRK